MGQSIDWIKDRLSMGDYKSVAVLIVDRFPQLTFPAGEDAYNAMSYTRQQIWRETCHLVGGLALGTLIPWYLVLAIMFSKEVFYDKLESGWPKALLDTSFWTLGALIHAL